MQTLICFITLVSAVPAYAQFDPRPATALDEIKSKHPTYTSEVAHLEILIQQKGYSVEDLLYHPEFYNGRRTPTENYVASDYVWRHHSGKVMPVDVFASRDGSNSLLVGWFLQRLEGWVARNLVQREILDKESARAAAKSLFETLDLRGVTDTSPGLPFHALFIETFSDDQWIDWALKLEERVRNLYDQGITSIPDPSDPIAPRRTYHLLQMAREITGHQELALRLVGLLLGSDLRIDRYFAYFNRALPDDTIKRITGFPKLVRAYADLVLWREGDTIDTFTYPGNAAESSLKTSYFYTEALLSYQLVRKGHSLEVARALCEELVNSYHQLKRDAQRVSYSVRVGGRWILASAVVAGTLGVLIDQIFLGGNRSLWPALGVGVVRGIIASRTVTPNRGRQRLDARQQAQREVAIRGADYGLETARTCGERMSVQPNRPPAQ